jgi:hypothetical protein
MRKRLGTPIVVLAVSAVLGSVSGCEQSTVEPRPILSTTRAERIVGRTSADVPAGERHAPRYVRGRAGGIGLQAHAPVIRVYQDEQPWAGANRAHATLLALGKILGDDYFIHPLDDLAGGIPAGTQVVLITSNSNGEESQATKQNDPAAQASLVTFLNTGGTLIVDMGDNLDPGGFIAPGATGTPALNFPDPCFDATLTPEAAGHPIVVGPDGVAGTGDDLDDSNIDVVPDLCSVAHGNLEDGITLPGDAIPLMTAVFSGVPRTIMAEYCHEGGRVILDTNTKEWFGQQPEGEGASFVMTNLFSYALSPASACVAALAVEIDIKPGNQQNPVNPRSRGKLRVAILTTPDFDATEVDPTTVTLGDGVGSDTPVSVKPNGILHTALQDVNGDGDLDRVFFFSTRALVANGDLTRSTTELVLLGQTEDGTPIRGADAVRVVP